MSDQYELGACRMLLANVLKRAVLDAQNGNREHRRGALWFIWGQEAERICDLLGRDVEDLRRVLGYARPEPDWEEVEDLGLWFSLCDFWQL